MPSPDFRILPADALPPKATHGYAQRLIESFVESDANAAEVKVDGRDYRQAYDTIREHLRRKSAIGVPVGVICRGGACWLFRTDRVQRT